MQKKRPQKPKASEENPHFGKIFALVLVVVWLGVMALMVFHPPEDDPIPKKEPGVPGIYQGLPYKH